MARKNMKEDDSIVKEKAQVKRSSSRSNANKRNYKGKGKKGDSKRGKAEERDEVRFKEDIPMKNGDKNPNWYFRDKAMAELVTQLAFQNLAGYPIDVNGKSYDVPNVNVIYLNPAPGVINSSDYGSILLNKTAGINLAGFRLFSELAAYTGRSAVYGPQDISTMILGLGEILSMMEFIRRAFGVAYTMNMRNRSYPRTILECMLIDPDDLFANFSDYRTRYNTLVTMINQLPIPASIPYFDKCQKIYEEIYLDTDSAMAQTLFTAPWSTWILDETSYSGGTILKTVPVSCGSNGTTRLTTVQPMSYFLNIADSLIGAMLNSSTLNVVYTDILNLAGKKTMSFLKLDYLAEGYAVMPRFSLEFMLQMHNSTLIGPPALPSLTTSPVNATPLNDVYPNASTNSLFYNPGFWPVAAGVARTGREVLVDCLNDSPDVIDRIEILRYASIGASNFFTSGGTGYVCDAVVPDHYIVGALMWNPTGTIVSDFFSSTIVGNNQWKRLSSLVANIDWAPRFYEYDATLTPPALSGHYTGDVNFYTTVNESWLRKVNQFIALTLYSVD